MKAELVFYDYNRKSQRGITASYIERTLGLSIERIGNDTLIVELNGYNEDDFKKNLKSYMHYGHGGIESINIMPLKMERIYNLEIGEKYKLDSGLGGTFNVFLKRREYADGMDYIFEVTNPGFEGLEIKVPESKTYLVQHLNVKV